MYSLGIIVYIKKIVVILQCLMYKKIFFFYIKKIVYNILNLKEFFLGI